MAGSPYKDSSTRMCVYVITSIHRWIGVTQSMRLFWNLSACSRICPVQFILSFTPVVSFTAAIISVSFISAPSLHLLPIFLTPHLEIWFLKRQSTENVCLSVLGMQIETSKQVTANRHLGFMTISSLCRKISNCRFNTFTTGLYSTFQNKLRDKIARCQCMFEGIKPFKESWAQRFTWRTSLAKVQLVQSNEMTSKSCSFASWERAMCQTQWVSAGLAAMPLQRRGGVVRAIWKSSRGNVTNPKGLKVHQHTVCKVHMIKERKTLDALWKHLCEQIYWATAVVATCETPDSGDERKLLLKTPFFCSKWSI